MAYLNICGFETGDFSECLASTGTVSIQSTTKRTGGYAFQTNLSATEGYITLGKPGATGVHAGFGDIATVYVATYVRIATQDQGLIHMDIINSGGTRVARVEATFTHTFRVVGSTVGSYSSALSLNTWYLFEFKATQNGAVELKIDGTSVSTCTATNNACDKVRIGVIGAAGAAINMYWDDIAISDSAYPGAGEVRILKPNATGNYTAWTNGAGTAPTNVAEVPHDSDTGYITSLVTNDAETEALDSAATGGVGGTIGTVKAVAINRDLTGTATVKVRARSATTDSDTTAATMTTSYAAYSKMLNVDPATSATWTSSGLDGLEVGVVDGNGIAARCTAIYAMVWSTGVTPIVVTPSTATLTTTKFAPVSKLGMRPSPSTLATTTATFAPTVRNAGKLVTPGVATLALSAYAPTVRLGKLVTPAAVGLTLTGFAPTVRFGKLVTPAPASLVIVTFAPLITVSDILRPGPVSIPLWTKGLYKPLHYAPLRYAPLRFKPPRYRKPF